MPRYWLAPLAVTLTAALTFGAMTAPAGSSTPTAGVVGDSLTVQANPGPTLTGAGYRTVVKAASGYSTTNLGVWGGFTYPKVLVFALGTNDAIGAYAGTTTVAQSLARLDAYLRRTRPRCTVIVGVVTNTGGTPLPAPRRVRADMERRGAEAGDRVRRLGRPRAAR